ncbi:MAG TPA: hypothetical protein VMP11_00070 [Verrucomicrobiae bacterium]|nr:hypothetical protein [Verrucomicrobiae bacterium]
MALIIGDALATRAQTSATRTDIEKAPRYLPLDISQIRYPRVAASIQ